MIESWKNGVIYTFAGVFQTESYNKLTFILSNGRKSERGNQGEAYKMPANAYKKTRSVRTYYDVHYGVDGFTFFDKNSKPIW
jgi:hypothetical protein